MKLWMVILVLSVACVNQPVRINAAEGQVIHQAAEKATEERTQQEAQQTADKKGQIAKQGEEIMEEKAQQTQQDRRHQTLKEYSHLATQQNGRKDQQATEEKRQQTQQATKAGKQQMQQTQQQQTTGQNARQTQHEQQMRKQQTKTHQTQQTTGEKEQISSNKQNQQQIQSTKQKRIENEEQTTEERKQQKQHHQQRQQHHRILFLYPYAPRSHSNFFGGIIDALVEAGHQVTVVSPHNVLRGRDGMRTIVVKEGDVGSLVNNPFQQHRFGAVFSVVSNSIVLCNDILAKPQVQELLNEEFDVVILSISLCDCFLSLVHQMKVPYIWLSPMGMAGAISVYSGTPMFPSFMGSKLLYFKHPLSFHQRVIVTLMESAFAAVHPVFFLPRIENMCRQRGLCPPDMPPFHDMIANGSLVILNSVKTLENPQWPSVPTEIHAGGINCRPAKPLPQELQEWVEGAGEAGFIYFSLGSIVKGSTIPEKTRMALLETFASLDQRVLWKWDQDTMAELPPNVRLAKWLPQQDILGHPRLRLFITHGGLMSTLEASYHGVPVLGLPVFGDQQGNMQQTEAEGWGRSIKWEGLEKETVREAILGVMNDAQMRAIAKQRSVLMQDQSMTPAETVVFWVGYVVRHKGAHHLRCPAVYLPWYQVYNVDVWATVALVVVAFFCITFRITVALCSCLCRSFVGKKKKD